MNLEGDYPEGADDGEYGAPGPSGKPKKRVRKEDRWIDGIEYDENGDPHSTFEIFQMKGVKGNMTKREYVEAQRAAELLGDCFDRIERAYEVMNWFASGKSMDQFSRVLPQDILAEVYFVLAPVYEHLKIVNDPKATQAARNWYERQLEAERVKMNANLNLEKHNAQVRCENAEKKASARINEVKDQCKLELYRAKSEMDERVRKAVAKAVKKTEDRLKGRQRVVPGSGRTVRL